MKDGSKKINEFYVIQILLYVENMGHLKLDGVYAQLYRRSEDLVGHWCGLMELAAPTVNEVKMIVGEAIEKAPESGLVKWVQESVKSHDFNELKSVALFFAHADLAVGLLFPNSNYREEVYLQLFNENDRIASNMVSSDFAFNWKDKEGVTVMQRLGHCFERMGDAVTAHSLSTIRGIRLNDLNNAGYAKTIVADNEDPKAITYYRQNGFRIRGCRNKFAGSRLSNTRKVKRFRKIVVSPKCKNVIRELKDLTYKKDAKGNVIYDQFNIDPHSFSAIWYALDTVTVADVKQKDFNSKAG